MTITKVHAIDIDKQHIKVGDEHTHIHYSKLVLAVGANMRQPRLSGDALERVYSVNDLLDYGDFRNAIERVDATSLCVIGAGLIGRKSTNDLLNGGFGIEVVDPMAHCLPNLLPEQAGRPVQSALKAQGDLIPKN